MVVATRGGNELSQVDFMGLKILTWNVSGMGNTDKRMAVCKGIGGVSPDILVI